MAGRPRKPQRERTASDAFDSGQKECVWMKAKVVNFKLCDREYDCADCFFDKGMRVAWKQESEDRETPA